MWLENLSMETIKSRKREAATGGVLLKKVFLEISQNSQENTCAKDSFLIMDSFLIFTGLIPAILLKKESLAQVFSCEFCGGSKKPFLKEHPWWLLLQKVEVIH